MKVVKVIPIAKGINKDTLSYFSSIAISPGTLVDINIRGKKKKGLVVEVEDVSKEKTNLKKEKFSLKKLEKENGNLLTTEAFSRAVLRAAKYFASSPGALFHEVLPSALLDLKTVNSSENKRTFHEKILLQAEVEERMTQYKSLIRETLALNQSVFVVFPTNHYSLKFFDILSKGISDFSFLLNSNLNRKKQKDIIKKILETDRAVVVFMTPQFLSVPRHDLGIIIVENEFSEFYKKKTRPFVDYRKFAEILAEEQKAKILFGDIYLRTETLWRESTHEFETLLPLKSRVAKDVEIEIIDMKKAERFSLFSPIVIKEIKSALETDNKIFLFSVRRGLHPITVCNDCGATIKCDRCDSPVVLHKSSAGNFFLCHKCGRGREAKDRCPDCNSWNLKTLGIGSSLLEKEIKKNFKEVKVFRLDGDSVKTPQAALKLAEEFKKEKKGILIGTKKALPYLEKVNLSVIVSVDSFFSIPDYKISEELFSLLLSIRSKTSSKIFIQTRNKEDKTLYFFKNGGLLDFYRKEIKEREQFKLPPFSRLIKFTFSGTRPKISRIAKSLEKNFQNYGIFTYPSFVKEIKGKFFYNGLIRLDKRRWPDQDLLERILELPPDIAVNVDPDSVL